MKVNDKPAMLKDNLYKYAQKCGLSNRLQIKSKLIIELLEKCPIDLHDERKNILRSFMIEKINKPNDIETHNRVSSSLKQWNNHEISIMIKFIGTFFHLLNQAELEEIIYINKIRDRASNYQNPKIDGIQSAVKYIKEKSIEFKDAYQILKSINVIPTFTAHPTETKRNSIINKQRKILHFLEKITSDELTKKEENQIKSEALRLCKLIFFTDDVRRHRISVEEEIQNVIKNTINSLWDAVPILAENLESAFFEYYNKKINIHEFINFHTWVGGDRDGNPNVGSDTTFFAITTQVKSLIIMYQQDLETLFKDFSISKEPKHKKTPLEDSIDQDLKAISIDEDLILKYQYEPIRLKILLIKEKLSLFYKNLVNKSHVNYNLKSFQNDLNLIKNYLENLDGGSSLIIGDLSRILIRSKIFGLHFMSIDIRQHSEIHQTVINEIFTFLKPKIDYKNLNEEKKCYFLKELIYNENFTFYAGKYELSDLLKETLDTFILIKYMNEIDKKIISAYIVSMTHSKSDILEIIFLAKLTGLVKFRDGKIVTDLKIVPLYETISDLQKAPKLLLELIEDDAFSLFLKNHKMFQEVMLGYSDSNKDGGFGMANYCLNQCIIKISKVLIDYKIDFRIFHGRGGSISRGGGKSNKAILSLPHIVQNGKIRFTEQGEVINYRYGSSRIAIRHLEQIISAQLLSLGSESKKNSSSTLIDGLMNSSLKYYKKNILNKKCWDFLINATPINHISKIPIASRPSSRKKIQSNNLQFQDLRAIPWVFSWTQTRCNLSGWYGMGHALENIVNDPQLLFRMRVQLKESPFLSQLFDNMSFEMARMRLDVFKIYANTENEKLFYNVILKDSNLAINAYKKITGYNSLLERNKIISNSIAFRNPFTDLLNYGQIELLRRYKRLKTKDENLDKIIFSSISHLAAAMQTSG